MSLSTTAATACRSANGDSTRGLLSLDAAGEVLVVAKCLPGRASAVAVEIDDAAIAEIVGTLAGEDTIFIAVRDQSTARRDHEEDLGDVWVVGSFAHWFIDSLENTNR